MALMVSALNYDVVGATCPADELWGARAPGFRSHERTILLGRGQSCWEAAATAVTAWRVKTRSGFTVRALCGGSIRVQEGVDYELLATLGPWSLREPVRVVAVVEEATRCGFAYGTRRGHPVSGEEAFIVHRTSDGAVWLTLRSLTRASPGRWRLAFPAALVAQRWYRYRYSRALLSV